MKKRFFTSDNSLLAYIPIEKCGSEWGQKYFQKCLNFDKEIIRDTHANVINPYPYIFIVFMRNPVRRWISGMAEYCRQKYGEDYKFTDNEFDLLCEGVVFDVHTFSQYSFIEDLPISQIKIFDLDHPEFRNHLRSFLSSQSVFSDCDVEIYNATEHDSAKKRYYDLFRSELRNNPDREKHVSFRYYRDFQFINYIRANIDEELATGLDYFVL
jgi:hypothetical protein